MAPRNCKGETDAGEPCESPFVGDDGYCPAHRPGGREKLREAGRKGGQAMAQRLSAAGLDPDDLPPLTSHDAAETWTDVVGRAAATGKLSSSAANAALRAVSIWEDVRESGEVSERLEALLDALQTWRNTGDESAVLELVN